MMQRRRLFTNAELEFVSNRGFFQTGLKGFWLTSFCDPLESPGNSPLGENVAAAMKNGMERFSHVVEDLTVVANIPIIAVKSVVAETVVAAE